ncbi:MAG: diguanylate cyclase [Devosia nanyangense]|nr:diguanylate cyclase [Devosia nanyangense]
MGVWQCELPSEQLKWSHGTYDLFGIQRNAPLKRSEIVGSYDEESLTRLHAVRAAAIASGTGFTLDAAIRTPDAKVRWIRISATVERSKGEPIRIFGIKQDITEEMLCRDRFEYLASHDAMTGLANRVQFEAQLENVCTRGDSESVLMLVDLDDFKRVNDTFGHLVGDDCLVEAARRLTATCHSAHLIARIGGDEFALLFASSSNRHAVERTAWHLVDVMNSPIVCRGHIITLGASVGLASATHQETSAIFGRADRALYAAKAAGGRSACWYHDMYPGREAY